MSKPPNQDVILDVFRKAVGSQQSLPGPHFADDEDLLLRWVEGSIAGDDHAAILKHMAECQPCRKEVAAMVRAGALRLPEVEPLRAEDCAQMLGETKVVQAAEHVVMPVKPASRSRHLRVWAVMAIASTILIGLFVWNQSEQQPDRILARAEKDLDAGNIGAAFDRVEELLDEELDQHTKGQAARLLEASGYVLARESLLAGQFRKVGATELIVSKHGEDSARLVNLRQQAEVGIPAEDALAWGGSLLDYKYEPDGSAPDKAFPQFDQTTERLDKQFVSATSNHAESVRLLLNYGHFLMTLTRYDQARRQFEKVLALDPESSLAHLGLGLVAFELREYQKALEHFEDVLTVDNNNFDAHVNAAMALQKIVAELDDRDEKEKTLERAIGHWQRAVELDEDDDLPSNLESHIQQLTRQIQ